MNSEDCLCIFLAKCLKGHFGSNNGLYFAACYKIHLKLLKLKEFSKITSLHLLSLILSVQMNGTAYLSIIYISCLSFRKLSIPVTASLG